MDEKEAKTIELERKAAATPRKFATGELVQVDASVSVLNGQDSYDATGENPSGGKGRWIPPEERVNVNRLHGSIVTEPYYSEQHQDLVYPVMEAHEVGGLVGVPQKALRRPKQSVVAGWSRAFERGWERIFGPKEPPAAPAELPFDGEE